MTTRPVGAGATNADQGRHHRESAASIRLKAQKLRRALDDDRLEDAVRVAADVAAELRAPGTASLTPKAYYDVYLSVCAELRVLEMYMMESARRGAAVLHLYERVQETPLVLPRLYLLVTTGSVYVRSAQAPAKDVLRDLVEMCAAVQHPQRGLFLRAYLSQMMKDKLPDVPPPDPIGTASANANSWGALELDEPDMMGAATAAAAAGTLVDSVEFVLRNFTEMNRLWVRMKNNVAAQEEDTVRKERLELRLLVGSNLSTLGRLLSNDMPMYTSRVLPALVEQIIDCRDAIAQEYLADCVAQAFPDEFQLATLDAYLRMCAALVRGVNLRTVLTSIIDRLTKFILSAPAAKDQVRAADVFSVFHRHFPAVLARQSTAMSLPDRLHVYLSLMRLVLTLEPEKTESVDAVLGLVLESAYLFVGPGESAVEEVNGNFYSSAPMGGAGVGQNAAAPKPTAQPLRAGLTDEEENLTTKILAMPLDEYQDVAVALRLGNFAELQHLLCFEKQYVLATRVLRSVREYTPCIETVPELEKLFVYVRPLVVGENTTRDRNIPEDMHSPAAIFNPATLSSHHAYLAAEVSLGTWNAATASGNPAPPQNDTRALAADVEPNSEPPSVHNYDEDPSHPLSQAEQLKQFQEAQELVARIVFLCHSDSVTGTLALYDLIRRELMLGDPKRRAITLPPLALSALQLAMRVSQTDGIGPSYPEPGLASLLGTPVDIVMFAVDCIDALATTHPMLALRLHLQAAVAAGTLAAAGAGAGSLVYDALARTFQLFEDAVTAANEQFVALELVVAVLAAAPVRGALAADAYTALARRAEKHAANLLSRSDQCLALLACTALYAHHGAASHDAADRAVACVDRAVAAARAVAATAERFFLWVSVANRIVNIVEGGTPAVAGKDRLRNVLLLMKEIVSNRATKNVPLGRAALRRRAALLAHIRATPNVFSFLSLADL